MPEIQQSTPVTVSQLTRAIKENLESSFPLVYLQGEISNFKEQTSGHFYFSLKDSESQISAVMFKGDASSIRLKPKGGEQVIVKGTLNVYPPKGNYQLVVRELSYIGVGELLQKLEELKIKLHLQGWFKQTRKKPIPKFPKIIGVVTSPTGAVIQDILNVLSRRFSGFHLILNPVKVQGEGAAEEIAEAIRNFNRYQLVDVMIVGRGGGSLEDLWAFNDEVVATAIYESQIPIISAVGHETDHCIADYVADVRAPTPSAAAEIVSAEKTQLLQQLNISKKRIQQAVHHLIQQNRYRLERIIKHPLIIRPKNFIELRMQKLDDFRQEIDLAFFRYIKEKKNQLLIKQHYASSFKPINQIKNFKEILTNQTKQLNQVVKNKIGEKKDKLRHIKQLLEAINPKLVIDKGYSILFPEKDKSVITSVKMVKEGQKARLLMSDGELLITINEIYERTPLSTEK